MNNTKKSTGNRSTGNMSTGNRSTGNRSISNYSSGHFCTIDYMGYSCFNVPITPDQWDKQVIPSRLYFDLTEWVSEEEMTETEKEENPNYKITGGFLKVYDYKEAFQKSYNNATREEQMKVKDIIHFDADIFYEISGIRVDDEVEEMTIDEICKRLGKTIKIIK